MKRWQARSLPLYSKKRTNGSGGDCPMPWGNGSVLLSAGGARSWDNGGIHWPKGTARGYLEQHPLVEIPPGRVGPTMPSLGTFGYNAICQTSQEILDGMYEYPPEFDEATKEIVQECALIPLKISALSIDTLITKEDWGYHWGKAREDTLLYQVIHLVLYCWFLGGKGTPGMFDPVL